MPELSLSSINANLLVALDVLLEEGSVSLAAERHGVTPSAMSHSLKQLRELFDDPLLIRSRHGMRPSPLAARLAAPLHKILRELALTVKLGPTFEPQTAKRSFIIAAPDFLGTFVLGPLLDILEEEGPGIDVEIQPISRRGSRFSLEHAWHLEEGALDLALGAVVPDMPGLKRSHLFDERFVCVVAGDHPCLANEHFDVDAYCAFPHLLISITDDRSPTWIDESLAKLGRKREVRARTRYFMAAPILAARSQLILTCPYRLASEFAKHYDLRILEPPLDLPRYGEYLVWHERFDADPGHQWLRDAVARATQAALDDAAVLPA